MDFAGVVVTSESLVLGGYNDNGNEFIASNNNTGNNLSPITTTPVIIYRGIQQHRR
jgi:hypothetical protein